MLPDSLNIHIITSSDRASRGEYEDLSGPEIARMVESYLREKEYLCETSITLIPDNPHELKDLVTTLSKQDVHIIFTTGGTGIGPKDFTPDVIKPMLDKEIPGIMEMIRVKYGMEKPNALISRSIAGLINECLIYVLPGSVKGVREYCKEILPTIIHSLKMIHAIDDHS